MFNLNNALYTLSDADSYWNAMNPQKTVANCLKSPGS